ncbi:uncharacterized protein C12B10.15c [Cucumis sativus]|uniref:Uncharacterized protein n=1 Tax=Cucumis sativus TaxID=3659 RepID=A0A0A0M1A2_CUCSA|nr:uncharacterized protein C12B10.15c [Cucumis sativus]KGN66902.1 hypothetical protein Csa_007140 [Cucumis sativus]
MNDQNERKGEVIVDFDFDFGTDPKALDISGKVHQLPCTIKFDGPCPVSHYFKPKSTGIEVDGLNLEEAYFRGRKLQGATISLPEGYSGYVLGKKSKASEQCDDSSPWQVKAKFDNITYWNHDTLPSQDDTFQRTFHWLTVAQALHKPVTAEDLASASTALKNLS